MNKEKIYKVEENNENNNEVAITNIRTQKKIR